MAQGPVAGADTAATPVCESILAHSWGFGCVWMYGSGLGWGVIVVMFGVGVRDWKRRMRDGRTGSYVNFVKENAVVQQDKGNGIVQRRTMSFLFPAQGALKSLETKKTASKFT